jgi:hypothetical protein
MQEIVKEPPKLSTDAGLRIDTKNTEVIANRAAIEIKLKILDLEYVREKNITFRDNPGKEIKRRSGMVWNKF